MITDDMIRAELEGLVHDTRQHERRRIAARIDARCVDLRHTGGNGVCLACHSIGAMVLGGEES